MNHQGNEKKRRKKRKENEIYSLWSSVWIHWKSSRRNNKTRNFLSRPFFGRIYLYTQIALKKESYHFPFYYLWYHIGRRLSSSWNKKWKKNTIFKGKRRKDNDSIRCVGVLTKGCDYLFHARLTHNSTHVDRDVLQQQLFSFSLSRVIGHTREERMKERKMNIKRNAMTLFSPFFSCCCVKVVVRRLYDSGWIATARFSDFCIIIRNIRKEKKKVI